MITFNNNDQRWLEIIFYFLCRKIYSINNNEQDIVDFIQGYRWTNMFDCDILISTVTEKNILTDSNFVPTKYEFWASMDDDDCRLRIEKQALRELIKDTEFTYWRRDIYKARMRKEVYHIELFPKLDSNTQIHNAIYSFLLAIRYIADIVKKVKF